ncbi:hypothetical protein BDW22DRAFT_185943 [Trametopsis cervina]|nr:hypothetical protein BDW22DRAFT_185943 [Trametopsis cervina]
MSDAIGECFGVVCSVCCICCTESFSQWCLFSTYICADRASSSENVHPSPIESWGSGSDSSTGCCMSCCKKSFDDDEFEKEEEKLRERRLAREAAQAQSADDESLPGRAPGSNIISSQPSAGQTMSARPSVEVQPQKEEQDRSGA